MIEFYPQIKMLHIASIMASGTLFSLRGLLMLFKAKIGNNIAVRVLSWTIDSTLLMTALMLITMLHQYPFVQAWLTVKVVFLVVYIVLGVFALRRGRSLRARALYFVAALAVFGFIYSVARAHHPLGIFYTLLG